jgi:hypothetical protein
VLILRENDDSIQILAKIVLQNFVRKEVNVESFLDEVDQILDFQMRVVLDEADLESEWAARIVE